MLAIVPLVLSMVPGFANAAGATEGFGILSMASIGPIIAVQATGLWIRLRIMLRRAVLLKKVAEAG